MIVFTFFSSGDCIFWPLLFFWKLKTGIFFTKMVSVPDGHWEHLLWKITSFQFLKKKKWPKNTVARWEKSKNYHYLCWFLNINFWLKFNYNCVAFCSSSINQRYVIFFCVFFVGGEYTGQTQVDLLNTSKKCSVNLINLCFFCQNKASFRSVPIGHLETFLWKKYEFLVSKKSDNYFIFLIWRLYFLATSFFLEIENW